MIKASRVLNTFSTLLFAATLLFVYSFLPISVDLNIEGVSSIHKQEFFFNCLLTFLVLNILLRLIVRVGLKNLTPLLQAWIGLIVFILNFYFTMLIGFIGVLNNSAHIAPQAYNYLNYIGPAFLVGWIGGLIFLAIKK